MSIRIAVVCAALAAGCGPSGDPGGGDTDRGSSGTSGGAASSGAATAPTWGAASAGTEDTTPWNIDTENPPATTAPLTTGVETGEPDTEDEEGSEGAEEDFVGWFGFGIAVPGVSYEAEGEAVVFLEGVDQCLLVWSASAEPDAGCEACEFAYTLTFVDAFPEADADCSLVGTDAQTLPGTTLGVGWSGEQLYVDMGEGWMLEEEGHAEYVEERGEFSWELPILE